MFKVFKVTAETFAINCVHTIKVNKIVNKSMLKMVDIKRSQMLKTFMTWLIKKLQANLRLMI